MRPLTLFGVLLLGAALLALPACSSSGSSDELGAPPPAEWNQEAPPPTTAPTTYNTDTASGGECTCVVTNPDCACSHCQGNAVRCECGDGAEPGVATKGAGSGERN